MVKDNKQTWKIRENAPGLAFESLFLIMTAGTMGF